MTRLKPSGTSAHEQRLQRRSPCCGLNKAADGDKVARQCVQSGDTSADDSCLLRPSCIELHHCNRQLIVAMAVLGLVCEGVSAVSSTSSDSHLVLGSLGGGPETG